MTAQELQADIVEALVRNGCAGRAGDWLDGDQAREVAYYIEQEVIAPLLARQAAEARRLGGTAREAAGAHGQAVLGLTTKHDVVARTAPDGPLVVIGSVFSAAAAANLADAVALAGLVDVQVALHYSRAEFDTARRAAGAGGPAPAEQREAGPVNCTRTTATV